MARGVIGITEGAGKAWSTETRVPDGSTSVESLYVVPDESAFPTYTALASSISTATSASHLIFIQAGGTLVTRIKRIFVEQVVGATTATLAQLQVIRTTTAGSGGGAITARGLDTADTYTGTIQTLPSAKGTEGNTLLQKRLWLLQTVNTQPFSWEWPLTPREARKPIVIGPATTDGICLKIVTGIATATVDITLELTTSETL